MPDQISGSRKGEGELSEHGEVGVAEYLSAGKCNKLRNIAALRGAIGLMHSSRASQRSWAPRYSSRLRRVCSQG